MNPTFVRTAEEEIPLAGLILKTGDTATSCALCKAADTPIGISTGHVPAGRLATIQPLADGMITCVGSGAITFGDQVQLAPNGKVATFTGGTVLGIARSSCVADQPIEVACGAGAGPVATLQVRISQSTAAPTVIPSIPTGTGMLHIGYNTATQVLAGVWFVDYTGSAWIKLI